MTTVAFNTHLGPHTRGPMFPFAEDFGVDIYQLNDSNDAFMWKFAIPADGTISEIGFFVASIVGSPPAYKIAILPVEIYGYPNFGSSGYGGSSIEQDTPSLGWNWYTLTTPATATAGDVVCVIVYPSASVPDTSNYISIEASSIYASTYYQLPTTLRFVTAFVTDDPGFGIFGIKYNDNSVYGFPLSDLVETPVVLNNSPDEVGNKFTLDFDVNCTGPSIAFYNNSNAEKGLKITLYDSNSTELRTLIYPYIDKITGNLSGFSKTTAIKEFTWDSPIQLLKDETYRLTITGITTPASGIGIMGIQFNELSSKVNNFFTNLRNWGSTIRTASGVWTDDATIIYDLGITIDAITIASSGVVTASQGGSYAYAS